MPHAYARQSRGSDFHQSRARREFTLQYVFHVIEKTRPPAAVISAALQHQDMDVFPQTWPLRALIEDGTLAGPPHHGIGRGFKVGKEEIAGLVAALELYQKRDFAAERTRWATDLECIAAGIKGVPGISARLVYPQPSGKEVPGLTVTVDAAAAGMDANAVINALQKGEPPVCVFEKSADAGEITFFPEALRPGEAAVVARRLRTVLEGAERAATASKTPVATRPG